MKPENILYPWRKDPEFQKILQFVDDCPKVQNVVNALYDLSHELKNHHTFEVAEVGRKILDILSRYNF